MSQIYSPPHPDWGQMPNEGLGRPALQARPDWSKKTFSQKQTAEGPLCVSGGGKRLHPGLEDVGNGKKTLKSLGFWPFAFWRGLGKKLPGGFGNGPSCPGD